jgi:hypothetical protein
VHWPETGSTTPDQETRLVPNLHRQSPEIFPGCSVGVAENGWIGREPGAKPLQGTPELRSASGRGTLVRSTWPQVWDPSVTRGVVGHRIQEVLRCRAV